MYENLVAQNIHIKPLAIPTNNHVTMLNTLLGLNFARIKFRGFRVFWPNPRISAKFNPVKNRYRRKPPH